jgi:hypothetical protein
MKSRWWKTEWILRDSNNTPREILIVLDYDLRSWLFGLSWDSDPCWHDVVMEFGPLRLTFTYFRIYVATPYP